MTPNVAFNNGYGVDAVLENWRFRSAHYEKIEVRLVRLEQGAENLLVAYLSNLTTVTETMLRQSLSCGDGTVPAFAWKLLGRQLEVPTCVHFRWSNNEIRFASAHYEADMLTPLFKLLGNLEDASIVLNSTLGIY
ncbi:hypothetical protein V7S43_004177 [Phytophthora oleae]|uniref:Uncharacterized protein n=1 Tax=Phytophthora oleae TaxID=2107226 RepID=A0ABD3FX79_9STRA